MLLGFCILVHTCSYGGTSATTKTRYDIDSTTYTATGYVVFQTTKTASTKEKVENSGCMFAVREPRFN
jgi:hypothetical protein